MSDNIAISLNDILKYNYVIPLYQRNYNWDVKQITKFIQDIYESSKNHPNKKYFIGSLVVLNRGNNTNANYEVIDGQQRLTTIMLVSRLLGKKFSEINLHYDSRPEVEDFFKEFVKFGEQTKPFNNESINSKLISFYNAIEYIVTAQLNIENDKHSSISTLSDNEKSILLNYFLNNVFMVLDEMPKDTDVAAYFEIMNNRGKQLQEHEIIKGRLMSGISSKKQRIIFGRVWDACSEMHKPIQKYFSSVERYHLFGDNYQDFFLTGLNKLEIEREEFKEFSIQDILNNNKNFTITEKHINEGETDADIEYTPIIDFTNFLIHILKLVYPSVDIPLSSDNLLKIFDSIPNEIRNSVNPMQFMKKLFFYRVVFDRYTVKADIGDEAQDAVEGTINEQDSNKPRWVLSMPYMYMTNNAKYQKKYPVLRFRNTYEGDIQERIIKLLSLLQVTYRQKRNKNYLYYLLSLFDMDRPSSLYISSDKFLSKMEYFLLDQFNKLELQLDNNNEELLCEGTRTPYLIFNLIDYLYWVETKFNDKNYIIENNFDFKYRNSIEHHYPKALIDSLKNSIILNKELTLNSLGNLCLVSGNANSKLNDREPIGKSKDPRFNNAILTPKRRIMYNLTNKDNNWNEEEIWKHYKEVMDLLKRRNEILGYA
ncbi:MAG: DUF262 domain-containing protein [Bacteroidetes bacterium]|nr:DUF262 domain-containing protein [Bacteroidota bacterium]